MKSPRLPFLQLSLFGEPKRPQAPPPTPDPGPGTPSTPNIAEDVEIDCSAALFFLAHTNGDPRQLARALDDRLERRLYRLVLTDNRSRILHCRPEAKAGRRTLVLRIHWSFLSAPAEVLDAVADFLQPSSRQRRGEALARMRRHFATHRRGDEPGAPLAKVLGRRARLRPRGRHFDLREIRDEVNRTYFGGELPVPITWSRASQPLRRRRRRSIHLGTYHFDQHLVRIHPALDQPGVPRYVVASVVHHELLHAAMPAETVRGRRRLHPPEFRRREKLFADYERAEAWIREHLETLLAWKG